MSDFLPELGDLPGHLEEGLQLWGLDFVRLTALDLAVVRELHAEALDLAPGVILQYHLDKAMSATLDSGQCPGEALLSCENQISTFFSVNTIYINNGSYCYRLSMKYETFLKDFRPN